MDFSTIFNLVLVVITIIAATSWGIVYKRSRSLIKNLTELRDKYREAVVDNTITDLEKVGIASEVIEVIDDAIAVWQQLENLVRKLILVFRKRR